MTGSLIPAYVSDSRVAVGSVIDYTVQCHENGQLRDIRVTNARVVMIDRIPPDSTGAPAIGIAVNVPHPSGIGSSFLTYTWGVHHHVDLHA